MNQNHTLHTIFQVRFANVAENEINILIFLATTIFKLRIPKKKNHGCSKQYFTILVPY